MWLSRTVLSSLTGNPVIKTCLWGKKHELGFFRLNAIKNYFITRSNQNVVLIKNVININRCNWFKTLIINDREFRMKENHLLTSVSCRRIETRWQTPFRPLPSPEGSRTCRTGGRTISECRLLSENLHLYLCCWSENSAEIEQREKFIWIKYLSY